MAYNFEVRGLVFNVRAESFHSRLFAETETSYDEATS